MRTRRPFAPLDADRQHLAEGGVGLAIFHARRVSARRRLDLDEAVSTALLALCLAASKFNAERCPNFGAYASLVIGHKLGAAEKSKARYQARVTRLTVDLDQDEAEVQVPDHREPEPGQDAETAEVIERLREALDPETFGLLWSAFAEGTYLAEIARAQGVSRQAVSQQAQAALSRARKVVPELCHQ
jgi:RNA polymerase sigma factor (sigma-70 family)